MDHNSEDPNNPGGFWRSFEQYHSDSLTQPLSADDPADEAVFEDMELGGLSAVSRRRFLGLMGASAALAGSGCSDYIDHGEILPYNKMPVGTLPGRPNYFASTCTACSDSCGTLVKTREGRPIKVDGNPDHPVNQGTICARGQASVLALYDPDRLRSPKDSKERSPSWSDVDKRVKAALQTAKDKGQTVALILPQIQSPALTALISELGKAYSNIEVHSYDFFSSDTASAAWKKAYGDVNLPVPAWEKMDLVLALESDFLGKGPGKVETARRFSARRDSMEASNFNRLYAVEGAMSLTGMNADHRLRLRPDLQLEFVFCLLNEIVVQKRVSQFASHAALKKKLSSHSLSNFVRKNGLSATSVTHLVDDLIEKRGRAFVHAGTSLSEEVHQAVNLLNEVLDAGAVYDNRRRHALYPTNSYGDWETLVAKMKSGRVGAVLHIDTNPVFDLPEDLKYVSALKKVAFVVSMTQIENETSKQSHLTLPIHHDLESWGDAKAQTNLISLQQPIISSLHDSRQKEGILLGWLGGSYQKDGWQKFLMDYWKKGIYPMVGKGVDFKTFWNAALHDGLVQFQEKSPPRAPYSLSPFLGIRLAAVNGSSFAVQLLENHTVGDGRLGNNGWLLELPHPVSKIVWDNYAAISKKTAEDLKVEPGDMLEIAISGRRVTLPAFIQPGMADRTVSVELGYGRKAAGVVGTGIGHDANVLLTRSRPHGERTFTGAEVKKTWGSYQLVTTQEHGAFEESAHPALTEKTRDAHLKREIIHENSLKGFEDHPDFLQKKMEKKRSHVKSLYDEEHKYTGQKWALAIDLNKCTGCNECLVACNAENNVPVVGKEQVYLNREMHWLRVDRYYSGTFEEPIVSLQPQMCHQCPL